MMKLKNYFFAAALVMMLAACSGNYDTPSGDTPVPTESYETVLNYFKEINAVPRPSRHEEKMREYLREFAKARGLRLIEDTSTRMPQRVWRTSPWCACRRTWTWFVWLPTAMTPTS